MNESQKRLDEKRQLRIRLENISIVLLAVFSFFLFLLTFFPFSRISQSMQASFEMGRMVQRAFSIVLFVLSLQLWKRKRNAWMIAMGIFTLNFLRGLIGMGHPLHNGVMIFDLVLFLLFFALRKDFCIPAGRENRKQTVTLAFLAIAGVLINVGITWHYMQVGTVAGSSVSFADSFAQGIGMIFGMGDLPASMADRHGTEFVLFWFSWGCILAAILCALRPWLQKQAHGAQEIQHARTLLNLYSQNPCSYLALEDDKCLYFGHSVDGVLPYGTVGDTIVVDGKDMVVTSREGKDGFVTINGGLEQGGVDLTSDDSGVYYAAGLDDAKSYHELGRITVPVAEGFVLTDNSDLEHPDETYAASDLAKLAASEPGFTANNTLATIEHGELTVLARSYTP